MGVVRRRSRVVRISVATLSVSRAIPFHFLLFVGAHAQLCAKPMQKTRQFDNWQSGDSASK